MTEADDRAGGKDVVDAMVQALVELYLPPLAHRTKQQVDELLEQKRPHARFILLGLKAQGYTLHKHYTSTACMHGLHTLCGEGMRLRGEEGQPHCKYCDAVCSCECHEQS